MAGGWQTLTGFRDRADAGRALAASCRDADLPLPVVLALPRGGVPVAAPVAEMLGAPLDVLPVRKIGCPGNPEFGIGAVAEGGGLYLDEESVERLALSRIEVQGAIDHATRELDAAIRRFRTGRPPVALDGRTAVIVDDGIATGGTVRAAIRAARGRGAASVAVATPVGAPDTVQRLRSEADVVITLLEPLDMGAIGWFYERFSPVSDDEVIALLDRGRPAVPAREVLIPTTDGEQLIGDLEAPRRTIGLVIFAHGSGSSRRSPRNRAVAARLRESGLATLLLDLLTPLEGEDRGHVFDIPLLARRLGDAIAWADCDAATRGLPLGLFGASTGAAAALIAAAADPEHVRAVVSRGGRVDLAEAALDTVRCPVLLLVGGADHEVLMLNREARTLLRCASRLDVIPGATHLFEEPGTLEAVAERAAGWFAGQLAPPPQ